MKSLQQELDMQAIVIIDNFSQTATNNLMAVEKRFAESKKLPLLIMRSQLLELSK